MPIPIHDLLHDHPLVPISPNATLREAVALMINHDFTQLPVVENDRPYGNPATFVTGSSIARALHFFGTTLESLRVRDALVPARTVSVDEDLFSKMDDLLDSYAVLVLRPDGTIAGIVTNYDTTLYFRRRAEDMLLVEDIETTLKDHVRIAYGGDEADPHGPLQTAVDSVGGPNDSVKDNCRRAFRRFCGQRGVQVAETDVYECVDRHFEREKKDRSFDDLTLNDYIQLARRPEAWAVLGPVFGIPDPAFREMLEGVRKTRNKLMHFRPDMDALGRDRLRFCAEWFKNHPAVPPQDDAAVEGLPLEMVAPVEPVATQPGDPVEYIEESPTDPGGGPSEAAAVDGKYAPLALFLSQQPQAHERLTLSFAEVERVIGAPLPAAARNHRAWWANDATAHVQSEQWLRVNWRVVSINMTKEQVVFARARDRERAYISFFSTVQGRLRDVPGFPLASLSPLGQNWLTLVGYPAAGRNLVLSFARGQRVRLECYIDTGDAVANDQIFEHLFHNRMLVETAVGLPLEWERLPGKRACRIALYTNGTITDETERLRELVDWAVAIAPRFHNAIQQTLSMGDDGGDGAPARP